MTLSFFRFQTAFQFKKMYVIVNCSQKATLRFTNPVLFNSQNFLFMCASQRVVQSRLIGWTYKVHDTLLFIGLYYEL